MAFVGKNTFFKKGRVVRIVFQKRFVVIAFQHHEVAVGHDVHYLLRNLARIGCDGNFFAAAPESRTLRKARRD